MEPFKSSSLLKPSQFGLLLAALLATSMWFYVERVQIPYQQAGAAAHGQPRGLLSDLYPRWLGARELLFRHRDPYSSEVTREIQAGYYGRPLDPSRPEDPKDLQGFAYPVYVVFLLVPVLWLPFREVQIGAVWVLGILTAASVFAWLRALRWWPSLTVVAMLLIMTLGSFPFAQGIKLQQLSLLVCALIAALIALLASGELVAAGILLGVATIKPQLVALLVAWLMFWAFSKWRERQNLFWSFAGTGLVLIAAAEYVMPGWIGEFSHALGEYRRYAGSGSPLEALTTPWVGEGLTVALLLATAAVCWRLRRAQAGSEDFNLALALILTVPLATLPTMAPYNQFLLVPAVFLSLRSWKGLWLQNATRRVACVAVALCFLWPWLASFALAVACFFLPPGTVQRAAVAPVWTIPATSIALLAPLGFLLRDALAQQRNA